jgi:flagellar basal body P-ring formation protein FlgA
MSVNIRNIGRRCGNRRRYQAVCAATGAVVVLTLMPLASAADICFQPTAYVSTSTVLLRDVATVSASDPAVMTRLEHVVLAPAPAPGRRMHLDFAEIRSRLEASGVPANELNYSGSSVVVVASADVRLPLKVTSHEMPKARLLAAPGQIKRAEQIVTDAVRRSMHERHTEKPSMFVEVMVDPADARTVLMSAGKGFEVGNINPKSTEPQVVQVAYQNAQGQPARLQVHCIVAERPQVPVLTHSVSRGDVIHESDLAWLPVDSTNGLLTRLDQIVDQEAKRSLHGNEPIKVDDVRKVPLVRANDIVTGIWRSGGIRITGQFKAKGDGGLGDVITIVKLTGQDKLTARVTDVHEAEIVSADGAKSAADGTDGENLGNDASTHESFVRRVAPPQAALRPQSTASTAAQAIFAEQR